MLLNSTNCLTRRYGAISLAGRNGCVGDGGGVVNGGGLKMELKVKVGWSGGLEMGGGNEMETKYGIWYGFIWG